MKKLVLGLLLLSGFASATASRYVDADYLQGGSNAPRNYIKNPYAARNTVGWTLYRQPQISSSVTSNSSSTLGTSSAHGLNVGDPIYFATVTGLTGITASTRYYVLSVPTTTSFTISSSRAGSQTTITGTPSSVFVVGMAFAMGTGGSQTAPTFARNTSSPLGAESDFLFTSNSGSEGVYYGFTIDKRHEAYPLQYCFDYSVNSGTLTTGDIQVWIYDVTNSKTIQPAPFEPVAVSGTSNTYCGTFQTSYNSTSYRLALHSVTNSVLALQLTNFNLGPQVTTQGPAISDSQSYTPIFTGLGTVSSVNVHYKQVGDTALIWGYLTAGTGTSSNVSMTLPAGLAIDYTKISTAAGGSYVGYSTQLEPTSNNVFTVNGVSQVLFADGSMTNAVFWSSVTNSSAYTKMIGTGFNTSTPITFYMQVPILGWSSNTITSNNAPTRRVGASYYISPSTLSLTSGSQINFDTKIFDDFGAVTTGSSWKFVAPFLGVYDITVSAVFDTGSTGNIYVWKNGSQFQLVGNSYGTGSGATTATNGTASLPLNAGDIIDIRPNASFTTYGGLPIQAYVTIKMQQGPSQINATQSTGARYYSSTSSISSSLATVTYATKDFDNTGSYSGGTYPCPGQGRFQVNAAIDVAGTFSLNATVDLQVQKNGTVVSEDKEFAGGVVTDLAAKVSDIVSCNNSDQITVQVSSSATSPSIVSSNTLNYFSIMRIGN